MQYEIMIDNLNTKGVSVKKQGYIEVDGVRYNVAEPHRKAYSNSESGRAALGAELPEPYYSAVMEVWGDTPTVVPEERHTTL